MRPRVFPAEDSENRLRPPMAERGFNEAAGIPRGRRHQGRRQSRRRAASMRPRVFPAEDSFERNLSHNHCQASMRPRVFPAEDFHLLGVSSSIPLGLQ